MSYEKISPLDLLYLNNPNGFEDYSILRKQLAKINSSILNTQVNTYHDLNTTSYSSARRTDNLDVGTPKFFKKIIYYGVVLEIAGSSNNNVYIDVPPFNTKTLQHIDNIAKEGVDLEDYEEMIFFPSRATLVSPPAIGGIAKVLIPENYPNHINTNNEDAIYLEMYKIDRIANTNRYAPPTPGIIIAGNNVYQAYSGPIIFGEIQIGEAEGIFVQEINKKYPRADYVKQATDIFNKVVNTLDRDPELYNCFAEASGELGIPLDFILTIAGIETALKNFPINTCQAEGYMQVTRGTQYTLLNNEEVIAILDKRFPGIKRQTIWYSKTKDIGGGKCKEVSSRVEFSGYNLASLKIKCLDIYFGCLVIKYLLGSDGRGRRSGQFDLLSTLYSYNAGIGNVQKTYSKVQSSLKENPTGWANAGINKQSAEYMARGAIIYPLFRDWLEKKKLRNEPIVQSDQTTTPTQANNQQQIVVSPNTVSSATFTVGSGQSQVTAAPVTSQTTIQSSTALLPTNGGIILR